MAERVARGRCKAGLTVDLLGGAQWCAPLVSQHKKGIDYASRVCREYLVRDWHGCCRASLYGNVKGYNMSDYNGWANKETWLVNVWYMDEMPQYFAEMDQYHVEANDLEEAVKYIAEECETLSQLPAGLLSDFINTCWGEVNWYELAKHLNHDLETYTSNLR